MTESNVNTTIPTESSPFSTTNVSSTIPSVPPTENPSPTSIVPDCNVIDCPFDTPFPEPTTTTTTTIPETVDTNTLVNSNTEIPEIPTSTIHNSTDSSDSTNLNNSNNFHLSHMTIMFIIIPMLLVMLSIIIGIIIYKRTHKKRNEGTILQFEPMHPHVVVVDADGNSLGKRNSTSNNSNFTNNSNFKGKGNRSPSRMIKVLACDEENGSIVGNNTNRKTMYYEDYR